MIWLTWRQFRVQALVVYAALAGLAVALALTGGHLADVYHDSAATFLDQIGSDRSDRTLYAVGVAVADVVPAVIGAFWGAPMVARELEAGTHTLVWSQSITRNRWLAHEARPGHARRRHGRRGCRTGNDVVVTADRQRGQRGPWRKRQHLRPDPDSARDVRLARDRPDRVRRVRVRPRRRGGRAPPAYGAGDGRHAGGLCPGPDRDAELGPATSGRAGPGDDV